MSDTALFDTSSLASPESSKPARAASLIFELQQLMALLVANVADEEEKYATKDPDDAEYPLVAKSMRRRIVNLEGTISLLRAGG